MVGASILGTGGGALGQAAIRHAAPRGPRIPAWPDRGSPSASRPCAHDTRAPATRRSGGRGCDRAWTSARPPAAALGIGHQRPGNADALALATGQLVGATVLAVLHAHLPQQCHAPSRGPPRPLRPRRSTVSSNWSSAVRRRHEVRLLEHETDAVAAHLRELSREPAS